LLLDVNCSSADPNCTWLFGGNQISSDANWFLPVNAIAGPIDNSTLQLSNACSSNPNCLYSER
jgi:hypothetical protein